MRKVILERSLAGGHWLIAEKCAGSEYLDVSLRRRYWSHKKKASVVVVKKLGSIHQAAFTGLANDMILTANFT